MKYKYIKSKKNFNDGVVLFIHGFATTSDYFDKLGELLSQNYDYYALELPGMGRSEIEDIKLLSPWYYAEIVVDWINQHPELGKINLIGHSMGGGIVNLVTAKIKDRINKTISICPMSSLISTKLFNANKIMQYKPKSVYKYAKIIYKYHDKLFPLKEEDPKIKESTEYFLSVKKPQKKLFSRMSSIKNLQLLNKAEKAITTPTLLITAKDDMIICSKATSKKLLKNPNFEWAEIQDSGHIPFIEQTEETYNTIMNFLQKK